MTVNRGLLIGGLLLAIIGAASVFVVNLIYAPPTDFIMAAREDISAGTRLSDLPDDAFVQVPVQFTNRTARLMLEGVAQPADLAAMKAAGAILIQDIYKYQPLTLGSVVSADNPAASRVTRLGLDDPDLVVITIPGNTQNIPEGIQPGDRIDLAVAVNDVNEVLVLEEEKEEQTLLTPGSALTGIPNEALAALLEEAGYVVESPEGQPVEGTEPTPTPEPTPEGPVLREPVTKILVRGALVVAVRQDTTVAGVSQQGEPTIIRGDITGLDVVIPREAFEFVTMAMNGGNLQIALLSPLVDESSEGPSLGASLQDLLDLFIRDREALTEPGQ
ncbi:MAG: hypothetical protein E4G99_10095 [Anaerolineales bacterium]|nr:MAG: hypothetical protein E4G99_10095 [Anaerolineales bacterium]